MLHRLSRAVATALRPCTTWAGHVGSRHKGFERVVGWTGRAESAFD